MIYKIMIDIRHFIMVMAVLIMAFAMSFIALGDGMIVSLFWVINTGMFDLTPPDQFDTSKETYSDTVTHVKIVFLILMGMVALILLNLLIAIMNSTYEEVRRVAALEVAYEKSRIILDIERFMLPVFMDLFHIEIELMFPRWLHILLPFTMIDAEHRRKQRREAQSEEHNENDDSKKEKSA